jgi:hypothetical protein
MEVVFGIVAGFLVFALFIHYPVTIELKQRNGEDELYKAQHSLTTAKVLIRQMVDSMDGRPETETKIASWPQRAKSFLQHHNF